MPAMVRTKQFDKHQALDQAMELFWERGYNATSISDLVERLGVNRQSLYDTFGGKDQLFLSALERYRKLQSAPVQQLLEREGPALEVLKGFFQKFVDTLVDGSAKGCFMANTITELAGRDQGVSKVCAANARQLETAFGGLLLRAQQAGEIPADRPVVPLARFLTSTLNGLAVTARATPDRPVLEDIVAV